MTEVPHFRKSSHCRTGTTCVEAWHSALRAVVTLRNSRDPQGVTLEFSEDEWAAFIAGVRAGEFDLDKETSR